MMAAHYGVGVLPARPRKMRDKVKVEAGVRFAQSYILGRPRHQTFFSLAECNTAIASCLDRMNVHVIAAIRKRCGFLGTIALNQATNGAKRRSRRLLSRSDGLR
jgi:hypothetical protein